MSRSHRKQPFAGISTAVSEKFDKRCANRRLRHENHCRVKAGKEPLQGRELYCDDCEGNKDGRMRFDARRFPKYMRK